MSDPRIVAILRFAARIEAGRAHDAKHGTNLADMMLIDAACTLRYPTLRLSRGEQEDR